MRSAAPVQRVGLISDTHGLLRPQALHFLRGCVHIIHGGDIGPPEVLASLAQLAPLTAVRGNNDTAAWAQRLNESERLRLGDTWVHVVHDAARLEADLAAEGVQVLVAGHSHKPRIERRGALLCVNPGSAGPRRFKLPVTVGELLIQGSECSARIVDLGEAGAA